MNQLIRAMAAVAVALAAIFALLKTTHLDQKISALSAPADDRFVFLPIIYGSASPAGAYDCYEYEFGLIWTGEAITLNADSSSLYAYSPPYPAIVTGTWVYSSPTQEVGFTNFRWVTTTFQPPDRLWASKYLSQAGFEIAVSCDRLR